MFAKLHRLVGVGIVPAALQVGHAAINETDEILFTRDTAGNIVATPLGTPQIGDVNGLQTALDGKSASGHGHAIGDVTDLVTQLAAKLAASSYTAADVLSKLLGVDGDTSGLDADLWKGRDLTVSTAAPSGGADGDIWFEIEA